MRAELAVCISLAMCGAEFANDTCVVTRNGRTMEMVAPVEPPPLESVLRAYGVDLQSPRSLTPFLAEALPFSDLQTQKVEALRTTELSRDPSTGAILAVDVEATVESRPASLMIYTADNDLVIVVTREDRKGETSYSVLDFEIVTPTSVSESAHAVGRVQDYYVVSLLYLRCQCDTAGGGSCSNDMCNNIETCPNKNGASCAWSSPVFVDLNDGGMATIAPSDPDESSP